VQSTQNESPCSMIAVYLCEYLGAFPVEVSSHGNCLSEGSEYVWIRPELTESVKEQCMQTKAKPNQIYTNMVVDAENEASCPRNLKQVQTRMWANAQRDGRPAEYRWRPLFNAAKFG